MAAKLVLIAPNNFSYSGYRIAWFEDGEEGLIVGSDKEWKETWLPDKESYGYQEAWETHVVAKAIHDEYSANLQGYKGFVWEEKSDAMKALRIAKEALKQKKPIPDWAKKALKAGWRPPKGWKA